MQSYQWPNSTQNQLIMKHDSYEHMQMSCYYNRFKFGLYIKVPLSISKKYPVYVFAIFD